MFLLIFHFSTNENYATDQKTFFTIDSWTANYQITKCVLHLNYAKPKNSTEAIYEWNPQLLSCQPNIYEYVWNQKEEMERKMANLNRLRYERVADVNTMLV